MVLLMASLLSGVDLQRIDEQVVIKETGARSGGDAAVMAITSPKESSCNLQGCRNTLQVGDEVSFGAFIKNVGDADITELSYSVTIYLTDSSQTVGGIAKDASGNDFVWENLDAMCDDGAVCDFDSTTSPLTAGSFLGGGKLTLQRSGADIVWTPTTGEYMVEIAVDSPNDSASSNDAALVYVIVEDWYDVEVKLTWLDSGGNDINVPSLDASSLSSAQFKLTVIADGSESFIPRDVTVRLTLSGQASGTIGMDSLSVNDVVAGTTSTVDTFENETDSTTKQTDTRTILSYQTGWELTGEITPGTQSDASWVLTAELLEYTVYGQYDECQETFTHQGNSNATVWHNFCEVTSTSDSMFRTDFAEITGSKATYDDIRISQLGVHQGYNSDCTGRASTYIQHGEIGDLNIGCSLIYAEVDHVGNDPTKSYDWNVSYSISRDGTTLDTGTLNDCTVGIEAPYSYAQLGGQSLVGAVCVQITLERGTYSFEMTLNMASVGDSDQRTSNNAATMVIDVINNLPLITSFELVNDGDLVVGQEEFLQLSVTAFDVDDPSGDGLSFYYSYQGGEMLGCGERNQTEGGTSCSTPILGEYIGNLAINIVVNDSHGGQVAETMMLVIWNDVVASATSESGIEIQYSLAYFSQSSFTIQTFSDGDHSPYEAINLEGYSGTYSAVAALTYAPSATFPANDVLSQSLSVIVDKALEATSLWYIDGSGKWILFDDESDDWDASNEVYTYSTSPGTPVIPAGTFVLIGGEMVSGPPEAVVSSFAAGALKGGAIGVTWGITGTLLSSDNIVVTICDGQEDCAEPFTQTVADEDRSYSYSGTNTDHNTVYHVSVAVCNEAGCSTAGKGTVTADKQVDYGVAATTLTVLEDGENWIISWDVTGDTSDVAMWHVCYNRGESFTAAEMPASCPDSVMGADANTLTIAQPTVAGTFEYYFTAVPMDALGNMKAAASMNSIVFTRIFDWDDDGTPDDTDEFPTDPSEWMDSDGDGVGDNSDAFPYDANETLDTDGDGYGDNSDVFPTNSEQWVDDDGDGYGDNSSGAMGDAFPQDYTQWNDTDGDGFGDNAAGFQPDACPSIFGNSTVDMMGCVDTDGDGYTNFLDAFPDDSTEYIDSDGDGVGDNSDAFPNDSSETADSDGDGMGDNEQRILEEALAQQAKEQRRLIIGSGVGFLAAIVAVVLWVRKRTGVAEDNDEVDEKYNQFVNQFSNNIATSEVSQPRRGPRRPPKVASGEWIDGYECLEYPTDSGNWFYRDPETEQWVDWE